MWFHELNPYRCAVPRKNFPDATVVEGDIRALSPDDVPGVPERSESVNCPIREFTADGISAGRCWSYLVGEICPRHGDVRKAVERFVATKQLTDEYELGGRFARATVRGQSRVR